MRVLFKSGQYRWQFLEPDVVYVTVPAEHDDFLAAVQDHLNDLADSACFGDACLLAHLPVELSCSIALLAVSARDDFHGEDFHVVLHALEGVHVRIHGVDDPVDGCEFEGYILAGASYHDEVLVEIVA